MGPREPPYGPLRGDELAEPDADLERVDWHALDEADKRKTEAMRAAAAASAPRCRCDRPWLMAADGDGSRCMKCGLLPRSRQSAGAAEAIVIEVDDR